MLERADSAALGSRYTISKTNMLQKSQPLWLLSQNTEPFGAEMTTEMQSECILRISTTMLLELDNNVTMDAKHDVEDSERSVLK